MNNNEEKPPRRLAYLLFIYCALFTWAIDMEDNVGKYQATRTQKSQGE